MALRARWAPISDAPKNQQDLDTSKFLLKHALGQPTSQAFPLDPNCGRMLHEKAKLDKESGAASLDGWRPAEVKDLPLHAFTLLAALFDAVDEDHPWPAGLLKAKSMWLLKPSSLPQEPTSMRIITIASAIYRLWAKARLEQAQPWIESQRDSSYFSAFRGRGAADAAMDLASRLD